MLGEEEPAPGEVEGELGEEEGDGPVAGGGWRGEGNAPGGDGHEEIEQRPDGGEDPVGRSEGWAYQGAVPSGDFVRGGTAADACDGEAEDDPEGKEQPAV